MINKMFIINKSPLSFNLFLILELLGKRSNLDSKKIGPYQRLSDRNLFLILHIKKLNVHCFTIFIINGINNVLGMHIIFNNCFTITKSVLYTFVQVIKVYIITICIYKIELRILEVFKSICINFHDYASFRHYSNT